jgi:hypothetical protein
MNVNRFGAPEPFGAHHFRVIVPATRDPVRVVEDFGYSGGEDGVPYEELRAEIPPDTWRVLRAPAQQEFNRRLKASKLPSGRWGPLTLVDRLLGKELCILAWASERQNAGCAAVVCARWEALRPEERWWLFSVTAAEAGHADDGDRGWRTALRAALGDGAVEPRIQRRRPPSDREPPTLFTFGAKT